MTRDIFRPVAQVVMSLCLMVCSKAPSASMRLAARVASLPAACALSFELGL